MSTESIRGLVSRLESLNEQELTDDELAINRPKAYKQFMDLYNFMAGQSLVHLLPSEGNFQDQVYVANLGLQLYHLLALLIF